MSERREPINDEESETFNLQTGSFEEKHTGKILKLEPAIKPMKLKRWQLSWFKKDLALTTKLLLEIRKSKK